MSLPGRPFAFSASKKVARPYTRLLVRVLRCLPDTLQRVFFDSLTSHNPLLAVLYSTFQKSCDSSYTVSYFGRERAGLGEVFYHFEFCSRGEREIPQQAAIGKVLIHVKVDFSDRDHGWTPARGPTLADWMKL